MQRTTKKTVLALSIAAMFSGAALAQESTATEGAAATVVVTGTRVANRSALDTSAAVDIISAETLKNSGTTEMNQALSVALPSLNFPRPSLTDGTDTIRPATLRGMAPDQSLVLVNSKRRHSSSLVNLNGSVGRGSAAVDMNTIPTAIVKNIEVLRDGAAAQYGSDAISGVINLRLRNDRSGGEAASPMARASPNTTCSTMSPRPAAPGPARPRASAPTARAPRPVSGRAWPWASRAS
jgi:iron complex outermembrane receptor protein